MYAWYGVALTQLGVKEIPGEGSNPQIEQYHASTSIGLSDDSVPWCASFVNWCLKRAGIAGTASPAARSFMQWGKGIASPVEGCICVFSRGDPNGWQGHVGFYVEEDESTISVLGGNQSDAVSIAKYPKANLLGYRMPKTAIDSKTVIATTTGATATVATLATELLTSFKTITEAITDDPLKPALMIIVIGLAGFIIWERVKKIRERQI